MNIEQSFLFSFSSHNLLKHRDIFLVRFLFRQSASAPAISIVSSASHIRKHIFPSLLSFLLAIPSIMLVFLYVLRPPASVGLPPLDLRWPSDRVGSRAPLRARSLCPCRTRRRWARPTAGSGLWWTPRSRSRSRCPRRRRHRVNNGALDIVVLPQIDKLQTISFQPYLVYALLLRQ